MGISEATFYEWKKKYGVLGVTELRELRQLKEENARLKQMVADLSVDKQMLQDVINKKHCNRPTNPVCAPLNRNWFLPFVILREQILDSIDGMRR